LRKVRISGRLNKTADFQPSASRTSGSFSITIPALKALGYSQPSASPTFAAKPLREVAFSLARLGFGLLPARPSRYRFSDFRPEAFTRREGTYTPVPATFRRQLETFPSVPATFRHQPDTSAPVPATFRRQLETFPPLPAKFRHQPDTSTPVPATFRRQPETFPPLPATFRRQLETFPPLPATFRRQPDTSTPVPARFAAATAHSGRKCAERTSA